MLDYVPGPTGEKFIQDDSFIKVIAGPIGSGKSTVALMDLLQRAITQEPFGGVRRTKAIIMRNTQAQLKSTVKPLIDSWCVDIPTRMGGYPMGQWRISDNTFDIHMRLQDDTTVRSELILMSADTPDDVRRLLSVECSYAWVEEAREIVEEVFSGLQGRVARYPSKAAGGVTYPGVICSTNPPALGTSWHKLITEPPVNAKIFIQPPALLGDGSINPEAENLSNLDADYYDNLLLGKTDGWVSVYLRNEFGPGEWGSPVYKGSFKSAFHVHKSELKPISQSLNPLVVGCDNGLTAAATIGQQDARGRINIFDECYVPEGETMGFESFLDKKLLPLLRNRFPMFRTDSILFSMDPACFARSSLDEKTLAQAVQKRGFRVVKASTNDPEKRVNAVENLLSRQIDGGPGFLIDPRCKHLIAGFEWAYRFKRTQSGQGTATPEKNHAANQADSCQYLALAFDAGVSGSYGVRSPARKIEKSAYVY